MTYRLRKKTTLLVSAALTAAVAAGVAVALVATPGNAASATAPANTAEPQILGTPFVGQTLTVSNGTWSGTTPMTFTYRWLRCPKDGGLANGSNCGVISNATKSTYQLRSADVGFRIRVRVTATNADGSAGATSNPTATVTSGKPVNTSLPTISGTPALGQTLTASPGTWTGSQPISFSGQWRRCNANGGSCSNIGGATATTYTLQSVDVGKTLRVSVTARNSDGSSSATSAQTAVITKPPATGCPSGASALVNDVNPPARLVIDQIQFSPSVVRRSTKAVVGRFHVIDTCGQPVQGALVYATAVPFNQLSVSEQPSGRDGWAHIDFRVLTGFPAARHQGLLVVFVRARKPGENLLAGISNRRLVSVRVHLG